MNINPRQQHAIALLAAGCRSAATAALCGIDRRTLYRWGKQPAFAAAVQQRVEAELRQRQALHVATSVAQQKARFAKVAVHVNALRSPTATLEQQRAAAVHVLSAAEHFLNIARNNDLQDDAKVNEAISDQNGTL
jgi:hypothetical protein